MPAPRPPIAAYRLQFHKGFGLRDALGLLDYLHALGARDVYASPLLKARAGSAHGYDVTDPGRINPEVGTPEDFDAFAEGLRARGMGLLLDIVPNHMAASLENPWWADVVEAGMESPHARMFDIDWRPDRPGARERLFLPILGKPFGEALESRELQLAFGPGGFKLRYMDHELPIHPATYALLFPEVFKAGEAGATGQWDGGGEDRRRLGDLLRFAESGDPMGYAARAFAKRKLWEAAQDDPRIARRIETAIARVNGVKGDPESFNELEDLLDAQNFLLAFWGAAGEELNYRRFFNINELVGLRAEDPLVFEQTHELILRLAREGKITGLRVDHIDGLREPAGYLTRLRDALAPRAGAAAGAGEGGASEGAGDGGREFYIIVEKILAEGETLPADWPIQGTTGYEFMNHLNDLFVDESGFEALNEIARRFTGEERGFREEAVARKRQVMLGLFPRELHMLARLALRAADLDRRGRDLTHTEIFNALVEISARLPVYRTYIRGGEATLRDRELIRAVVEECARDDSAPSARAMEFLERALTGRAGRPLPGEPAPGPAPELIARWQQFTGPAMAKGLEDTAHYTFARFISKNEVGGDPGAAPGGVELFHERNAERAARFPRALNASSTHDGKRSEDVRARINVLSEAPEAWNAALTRWSAMNAPLRREIGGAAAPDPTEEIFIYQTLIGAWPPTPAEEPAFRDRLRRYLTKAMREAKRRTDWIHPNEAWEAAVLEFADAITEAGRGAEFLADFREFVAPIMLHGALNSLSAALLKIASPGVPDFYQGTELWDFSLVDPDNRRPVDYPKRIAALPGLEALETLESMDAPEGNAAGLRGLLENWRDGRVKMFAIRRALAARAAAPELFSEGSYEPLRARGANSARVCAFMRRSGKAAAVALAPRLTLGLGSDRGETAVMPLGPEVWGDAEIETPPGAEGAWRNVFTGEEIQFGKMINVGEALARFPAALLIGRA